MTLTEPARGELAPTASHAAREWQVLPATGAEGDGRSFTLSILLTTGRKVLRTTFHWYAVTELEFAGGAGRKFVLRKEREPDAAPIVCVVGGAVETCDCESGKWDARRVRQLGCKHRSALRQLCEREVL